MIDPMLLEAWLATTEAHVLFPCVTPSLRQKIVAAAVSMSEQLPSAVSNFEEVDIAQSFVSAKLHGSQLTSGLVQITFEEITLAYRLEWANPLWLRLQYDESLERDQVLGALRATLIDLPSPMIRPQHTVVELKLAWPQLHQIHLQLMQVLQQGRVTFGLLLASIWGGGSTFFDAHTHSWVWIGAAMVLAGVVWALGLISTPSFGPTFLAICDGKIAVERPPSLPTELPLTPVVVSGVEPLTGTCSSPTHSEELSLSSYEMISKASSLSSSSPLTPASFSHVTTEDCMITGHYVG